MHRAPLQVSPENAALIEALLDPAAFDYPVSRTELIETHISWVVLAGEFVYKIKKPLVLDFLDFGSLERRRHFCEEEIRLNKPWAPEIYLEVVPISVVDGQAKFGDDSDPVEYAVRMRRFDQDLRLDCQLKAGKLSVEDMKELAQNIGLRHESAPRIESTQRDRVLDLTASFMRDNFDSLESGIDAAILDTLREWTERELQQHFDLLAERFDAGFVRDCHGDLHLGNLVRLPSGITTFDCIEFNTDLRHIDVFADIAFLVMDLVARKRHDLAAHFLNRYLEVTGDYGGVSLLSVFFVYRCLVRAKVAMIRSSERDDDADRAADVNESLFYCDMATRQAVQRTPILLIMHGLSGSGKTRVSGQLMAALPAIRLRSDIERKRMFEVPELASSESGVGEGIYSKDAGIAVYERLNDTARRLLSSGHSVILDAAFLKQAERAAAKKVASACHSPVVIVDVTAPESVLRNRLVERAASRGDVSEADEKILDYQLRTAEQLGAAEEDIVIDCDNSTDVDLSSLVAKINNVVSRKIQRENVE